MQAATTFANSSRQGESPQLTVSGEEGIAGQCVFAMETPGADNEYDNSDSEDCTEDDLDGAYHDAEDATKVEETEYNENDAKAPEEDPVRMARNTVDAMLEARARHDATHLPFRPSCLVYVEVQATEDPYYCRIADQHEHGRMHVRVDYYEILENVKDKPDKQWSFITKDI